MNELKERFEEAKSLYPSLKESCENQIARWEAATSNYYETNPLYHKINGLSKGTLIKDHISDYNSYQYGFDADNKLILKRQPVRFETVQ